MKTLLKILVTLAILAVIVIAAACAISSCVNDNIESAVTQATGNSKAGALASALMNGSDIDDADIQDALGVDSATYNKIKEAAAGAGIDITDSDQLRDALADNVGNLGSTSEVVSQLSSGEISSDEAASELASLLGAKKAE